MTEERTDELQRFLAEHVDSYEELELLVFFRSGAQGSCSADQLAAKFGIPEHVALDALEALTKRGFLSRASGAPKLFYYAPRDPALHQGAGVVHDEYQRNRLHVIHLMTSNALERLRGSTLRTFADCFRVRGPKDRG